MNAPLILGAEPSVVEHEVPAATEENALDDRFFFADHPARKFRARAGNDGLWLIRRRPQGGGSDVYLRTFSRTQLPADSDAAIAISWYRATWPDKPCDEVRKAAAKALKEAGP